MRTLYALATALTLTLNGCSSIQATYLGNPSNGDKADGMPIVVERPRYLKVTEREVQYLIVAARDDRADEGQMPDNNPNAPQTPPMGSENIISETSGVTVDFEVVTVGEVYAVDFRRPGAGKGEFSMEFPEDGQYPSKVTGKTEDETIKQIGESIASIVEKGVKGLTPTAGEIEAALQAAGFRVRVVEIPTRVIRIRLFDLDQLTNPNYAPVVLY